MNQGNSNIDLTGQNIVCNECDTVAYVCIVENKVNMIAWRVCGVGFFGDTAIKLRNEAAVNLVRQEINDNRSGSVGKTGGSKFVKQIRNKLPIIKTRFRIE